MNLDRAMLMVAGVAPEMRRRGADQITVLVLLVANARAIAMEDPPRRLAPGAAL